MAEQETVGESALAVRAHSPCFKKEHLTSSFGMTLPADGDALLHMKRHKRHYNGKKTRDMNEYTAISKADEIQKHLPEKLNTETTDKMPDILITDEVLRQLHMQAERKASKTAKQSRPKTNKPPRKSTKMIEPAHTGKSLRSSQRRKGRDSAVDPPSFLCRDLGHVDINKEEEVQNKAQNNNWVVGGDASADAFTSITVPSLRGKSYLADREVDPQQTDSLGKVCFTKNCASLDCKPIAITDPVTSKELSFTRADSSDDSGCFSNLSTQSTMSPGAENREGHKEKYSVKKRPEGSYVSSTTPKPGSDGTGLCSVCGSEPQGTGDGLCKHCIGRFKQEGIRIGALGEIRAYALSIADSVKRILSISPKDKTEVFSRLLSDVDSQKVLMSQTDSANVGFQEYVKNIAMSSEKSSKGQELRVEVKGSGFTEADTEKYVKHSCKYLQEINALRLKVIHEGSPVDPLNPVEQQKSEDAKDRRAAFIRSATAPNKNHMPKKDSVSGDKSVKGIAKMNRSNTMKRNKTTYMRGEGGVREDKGKRATVTEPQPETWRDDTSIMAAQPIDRGRSASCDSSRAMHFIRGDSHRSVSRSALDRENVRRKKRREAKAKEKTPAKKGSERESRYPLRCTVQSKDGHQILVNPAMKESAEEKFSSVDPAKKGFLPGSLNALMPFTSSDLERKHLKDQAIYFQNVDYNEKGNSELILVRDKGVTETYYCQALAPGVKVSAGGAVMNVDQCSIVSAYKSGTVDNAYHREDEKDGLWYNANQEDRALRCRDRSHESKSSTSFQIVTTARSSHSDVALLKHNGAWDHVQSRRQPVYSETNVDTGFIYHFSKRQTTRAHVPPFRDFTNASKDIYTMSGDVSTSASSNSAVSAKSEVSDSAYTGGFFKRDPFYDNDVKSSSTSSSVSKAANSSNYLYFEPDEVATKPEPSELDIYTGAIFSSSQNALSLGTAQKNADPTYAALKDGSTNNSTRPPLSRMSRRLRYRPHIDVIKFKCTDSPGEFLSKSTLSYCENKFYNTSNNSSSFRAGDDSGEMVYEGAIVTKSKDSMYSMYADDDCNTRAEFHVQTLARSAPTFNFLKYESQDDAGPEFFFRAPKTTSPSASSTWYSGFKVQTFDNQGKEGLPKHKPPPVDNSLAWQSTDDYYTVQIRPWADKTNNCNCESYEQTSGNYNNNYFEDLYTGYSAGPNLKPLVQEPPSDYKKSASDKWYLENQEVNHSPKIFYEQPNSGATNVKKSPSDVYENTDASYPSTNVFGQGAYSGTGTYATEQGWGDGDQYQMPSKSSYSEPLERRQLSPERANLGEKYSYFQYVSNESPSRRVLLQDEDMYSFENSFGKVESVIHEIKKVGGIVCRENVANKEDYAEDVNRDLEQAGWTPFNFRHDEKPKIPTEMSIVRPTFRPEQTKPVDAVAQAKLMKPQEDNTYNQDHIYDNVGARKKWRQMAKKQEPQKPMSRQSSYKSHQQAGDMKRQEYEKKTAWNPPDQIPERARGKRTIHNPPKPTILEETAGQKQPTNVISSVTSIPSRLTSYVRKWF